MRPRARASMLLCVAIWSQVGAAPIAEPTNDLPDDARVTMLDMNIVNLVLDAAHFSVETGQAPVRLDAVLSGLDSLFRKRLPTRDGWGRPLLYWERADTRVLLSVGEDGRLDDTYDFSSEQVVKSMSGDDIVSVGPYFVKRPLTQNGKQTATMADIRSIGTAVESFGVENDAYPRPTAGVGLVESVRDQLEPNYIKELPTTDAWGNPYLFWSDGTSYMIVSLGSDGVADVPYGDASPPRSVIKGGPARGSESDIVFVDGEFIQWPEVVGTD